MEVSDEGDFLLAIDRYTEAITLNRNNHILFSNRSAAYARVGKFAEALEDAKRCHELKSDWPKVSLRVLLRGLWPNLLPKFAAGRHMADKPSLLTQSNLGVVFSLQLAVLLWQCY